MALAMRALRFHDARNALTVCWRRIVGIFPPFRIFEQGPVEFEKIAFVPSKLENLFCPNEQDLHAKLSV